jgi:two-component system, chemotaxis family, CheB/CheR fusion protein
MAIGAIMKKGAGSKEELAPKRAAKASKAKAPNGKTKTLRPEVSGSNKALRVVGIGASAGGLEAFESFLSNLPKNTGLAFVLIQHLDPTHRSILTDLLAKYTPMPVREVKDGMLVEPNNVYVIPPNRDMGILDGRLYLMEPTAARGFRQPIDFFFRSLAQDVKERAVAIVLSGTGTEGTLGIRAVKGEGGMVMVQDPATAKYDGMPRSAVATGIADYILPTDKMPERLMGYIKHVPVFQHLTDKTSEDEDGNVVQKILILVRGRTRHDFTNYKRSTIVRRIERRMAVHQLPTKHDYLRFLQEEPSEIKSLFKEVLIGVTNFFRDPEAFDLMKKKIVPGIVEDNGPQIRVWVPACTTGEEAYSIAMLFQEYLDKTKSGSTVQIFATDIDGEAIEKARLGVYPLSIAADVSPERIERFFTKEDNQFRVKKSLRDLIVFAVQNVASDPPFSKLDMISCRNLLIYMNAELQRKVVHIFHYALRFNGVLFLGSSESVGSSADLYSFIDRKWKFYRRRETSIAGSHPHMRFQGDIDQPPALPDVRIAKSTFRDFAEMALLETYSAAGVVIDEKYDILYFYGDTSRYLGLSAGMATLNLLKISQESLRFELANSIRSAQNGNTTIHRSGLKLVSNSNHITINLIVRPVPGPANRRLLAVIFEDVTETGSRIVTDSHPTGDPSIQSGIQELERELASTKEYLQTNYDRRVGNIERGAEIHQ